MAADDYDDDDTLDQDDAPPPRLKSKVTTLTIILIVLNLLVAPGFLYLLLANYQARTNWSHMTFLHHVSIWGLPLEEEEQERSLAQASLPSLQIEGSRLQDAFRKRPTTGTDVKGGESFANVDEPAPLRIKPSDLTDTALKHIFTGAPGQQVRTLEEEVRRLQQEVPAALDEAASNVVAKVGNDEARKRQAAEQLLLPLAWSYRQVQTLKERIDETPATDLDALLRDAVQRRLLKDILAPLNVHQPGDVEKYTVEKIGDLDAYSIEQLKGLLEQHFTAAISNQHLGEVNLGKDLDGQPRDTIDKREDIALLLFVLGQVKVPLTNEPLLPDQLQRAQTVVGLYQFTLAGHRYAGTFGVLEDRILQALAADREGYEVLLKDAQGKEIVARTRGFIQEHDAEVQRLRKIVKDIRHTEERLQDLQQQRDEYQKDYQGRLEHLKELTAKLADARQQTQQALQELRRYQQELFEANLELAEAAERNYELMLQIREAEGLKGAK